MYKAWWCSAPAGETLAKLVEAHLNEFADEVISVAYSISDEHNVLAIYREIAESHESEMEASVSIAEQILDEANA